MQLTERPEECEAAQCLCPFGRNYDSLTDTSIHSLIFCQYCGSRCVHRECNRPETKEDKLDINRNRRRRSRSSIKIDSEKYVCNDCESIVAPAAATNNNNAVTVEEPSARRSIPSPQLSPASPRVSLLPARPQRPTSGVIDIDDDSDEIIVIDDDDDDEDDPVETSATVKCVMSMQCSSDSSATAEVFSGNDAMDISEESSSIDIGNRSFPVSDDDVMYIGVVDTPAQKIEDADELLDELLNGLNKENSVPTGGKRHEPSDPSDVLGSRVDGTPNREPICGQEDDRTLQDSACLRTSRLKAMAVGNIHSFFLTSIQDNAIVKKSISNSGLLTDSQKCSRLSRMSFGKRIRKYKKSPGQNSNDRKIQERNSFNELFHGSVSKDRNSNGCECKTFDSPENMKKLPPNKTPLSQTKLERFFIHSASENTQTPLRRAIHTEFENDIKPVKLNQKCITDFADEFKPLISSIKASTHSDDKTKPDIPKIKLEHEVQPIHEAFYTPKKISHRRDIIDEKDRSKIFDSDDEIKPIGLSKRRNLINSKMGNISQKQSEQMIRDYIYNWNPKSASFDSSSTGMGNHQRVIADEKVDYVTSPKYARFRLKKCSIVLDRIDENLVKKYMTKRKSSHADDEAGARPTKRRRVSHTKTSNQQKAQRA